MKTSRSTVVTAGVAAAAALVATGITYASAASVPAAAPAAPAVQAAPAAPAAAPAAGPMDGGAQKGGDYDEGRILVNERSYSTHSGDCITVISGLGAKTLNIRNDSRKTVEVFRGVVCDNGAPVATVGPHSSSDGVHVRHTKGVKVKDGVVGSFRVVDHDYKD
ncbi:hypothetical protein ACF1A5_05450 [Streptomyces sp. NPDC014864]|uniref:hypothetical protein n=1 Tax=Streptomyces sp. NPDC014864 TaxID=3364924 RepID=UPI0036F820C1